MTKRITTMVIITVTSLLLAMGGTVAQGAIVLPRTNPEYFTIAVLPDTQWYSKYWPEIFREQTQWIANNEGTENIRFVIHVGDVVQNSEDLAQWDNARGAMDILGDIPYLVVGGNHDGLCGTGGACNFDNFRQYFGEPSSHTLFSVGYRHFVVVGMEWYEARYPDPLYTQITEWLNAYPEREAIFVTHAFANLDGGWTGTPGGYSQWLAIADAPNLFMALWGHYRGAYYDSIQGTQGNTVHRLLADYQCNPNGGNGWMRLLRFYPDGSIWVLTYSPWLDTYRAEQSSAFKIFPDEG